MSGDGGNDRGSDDHESDDRESGNRGPDDHETGNRESDDRESDDRESEEAERDRPASRVESLSIDATLELLADRERRAVLGYLMDDPRGTATVSELADHLAEMRAEEAGDEADPEEAGDEATTTLHHVHLPKLADAGVVEYDDRSGEVRYWGEDRLEAWYDHVESYGDE